MTKILRSYVALLFSFLLLGCSGGSEDTTPETSPSLERIHIVASPVSTRGSSSLILAKGNTQPFMATGHYGDGSVKDLTSETSWHSSDDRIATMSSPGALTARDAGTTTVTASHDGIISNTIQITVTDAVLTAIQVTPPSVSLAKGQTRQLTATATYSDNTTADVTGSVAWLSDDTATATVTTNGLLTGVEEGTTEISASLDGVTSDRVTVNVVVTTLFGEFEDVFVNDFTFAVDAGFPTTGFDGAEFTLNTPNAPSAYTWSGDAAWVSVDNGGTVRFISQGDSSPVTITATPKSGGRPLVYTFAVNSWFHSNGGPELSQVDARFWCGEELVPRFTWSVPTYPLLNEKPSARGTIGMLWSEWGNMRMYSDSTFTNGFNYWTTSAVTTGKYYWVALGQNTGWISWSSGTDLKSVVCRLEL